ncbi:MAG: membrane protein insertase YidC [Tepidisphaerales bacterium]
MDNKRLILVMAISFMLMMGWMSLSQYMLRTHPEWNQSKEPATAPSQPPPASQAAATRTAPATAPAVAIEAVNVDRNQSATLGFTGFDPKQQQKYSLGLELDARGASVRSVTLNRFRQAVGKDDPYVFQKPYAVGEAMKRQSLASQWLTVDGQGIDLSSRNWELVSSAADSAVYRLTVKTGAGPVTITKTYQIRPAASASLGYEVVVSHQFSSQATGPLKLRLWYSGPTIPHVENSRDMPEVVAGHDKDGTVVVTNNSATGFKPESAPQPIETKEGPLQWSGLLSTYFEAIVRPQLGKGEKTALDKVEVKALDKADEDGNVFVALTFETKELTLEAGQTVNSDLGVYFGPRWRDVLNSDYYAGLGYNKTLVLASGFCGMCTFQRLVDVLVWLLNVFHTVLRDWGLSIIALVIIVRLVLHPITKKSQIMMSKMGKLQPEMERLKKKHGDNKEELQKEMIVLYKEQGFTPILGCLPMFLQMPIWIALWSCLQSTFELRQAPFLWGLTWMKDLAQPDRLISFAPKNVWLIFTTARIDGINILPLFLAVVFWLQQKMTPKPPAMDDQQAQQQKMMQWMTLLFPLLLYNGPCGLNLYILTSTTIGIIESKIVRDHIKAREEAEKAGKVIVDAGPSRASRKSAPPAKPAKKGGLSGFMESLSKKAEEWQKEMERRKKK